jgi:methyl-accepting chemotaxis protein
MAKNLTHLHKTLDRILEKLGTVDETRSIIQQIAETNRQLARSVGILTKIAAEGREEGRRIAQMQADIAHLTQESLKASRESAERTAQILAETRRH